MDYAAYICKAFAELAPNVSFVENENCDCFR